MPHLMDDAFRAALAHHQAGEWVEASQICRQILDQNPNHPPALHLLGILARRGKNPQLSASLLRLAVVNRPDEVSYHHDLGITLMELKQMDDAAAEFTRAIRIRPDLFEPRIGLAAALREQGRFDEAIACYQQTLLIRPGLLQTKIELGHLYLRTGQMSAAIACYREAIELTPGHLDAHNSLGNALTALEKFEEAEQVFRNALKLNPNSGPVWNNLGNLFRVQAKTDEAMDAYQHAVEANPDLAAAHSNLGNLLKDHGKLHEAIAALRRAVELDPDSPALFSNLVYSLLFDPAQDAGQILAETRRWADRFESPLISTQPLHENDTDPNRRLRIGYISADFRGHVIGRNVLPILEHHNHVDFEIHCFSTLARADAETAQFAGAADHWHECVAMTDAQLAEKVRRERIDLLVDLSLHLSENRLLTFARKPAPVQVTWAGYPGTTGLRSIDYRITDPHLDPPGETDGFYTEQSVRLPTVFGAIDRCPGPRR